MHQCIVDTRKFIFVLSYLLALMSSLIRYHLCRSATLVGCYLMAANDWTPSQAVDHMRQLRPHILLHRAQREALETFYKQHMAGKS